MSETKTKEKKGFILRALDTVERVGNGLPNPATIFIILTAVVIVISAICAACGVSVSYDDFNSDALTDYRDCLEYVNGSLVLNEKNEPFGSGQHPLHGNEGCQQLYGILRTGYCIYDYDRCRRCRRYRLLIRSSS